MRGFVLSILAVSFLAACGAGPDDEAAPTADAPEAAQQGRQVRPVMLGALSRTAMAFTGDLSLTALPRSADALPRMRMEMMTGGVYETELITDGAEAAADAIDWSVLFAAPIDLSSREGGATSVDLHRVVREEISPDAPNGGLCGREATTIIAMAAPLNGAAGPSVGVAAFRGNVWPPEDEAALCGVYLYAPP